jgi:hypothetical protein
LIKFGGNILTRELIGLLYWILGTLLKRTLLTATALGLQTWLTGAFYDSKVEEFLEIKASTESSMFFIGIGHGDNQSIPSEILKMLQEGLVHYRRRIKPKKCLDKISKFYLGIPPRSILLIVSNTFLPIVLKLLLKRMNI